MKIWPFDFAKGASSGLEISNYDLKNILNPLKKYVKHMEIILE